MTTIESTQAYGPDPDPYKVATSDAMIQIAEEWLIEITADPVDGSYPMYAVYMAVRCAQGHDDRVGDPTATFIIALTDRSGRSYRLTLGAVRAAVLTHLYRMHGYRPDGTRAEQEPLSA
jgi:hypothetical protein